MQVKDEELLSLILAKGNKPSDNSVLANYLLSHFGGLQSLLTASCEELKQSPGIILPQVLAIGALAEIANRLQSCPSKESKIKVRTALDAYRVLRDLSLESQEVVSALFLDSQNRVICRKELFRGTVDSSLAQPREILRAALRANACSFLVAHNHPSQDPQPSQADWDLTSQLYEAARWVGIPLVDHLIICEAEKFYSFAANEGLPIRRSSRLTERRGRLHDCR